MSYVRCLVLFAVALCCYAGPIGVDGIFGPEWAGVTPTFVPHIAGTPPGTFGGPQPGTDNFGYNIYLRGDGLFIYGFLQSVPEAGVTDGGNFANLYFGTNPSFPHSTVGFELTNRDAFIPTAVGPTVLFDIASFLTLATTTNAPPLPDTLEFALPTSFFTGDPLGMGFPKSDEGAIVLRLSQSFGLSVAGGATFGPNLLGIASTVPEPCTLPLLALGLSALVGYRRRRK